MGRYLDTRTGVAMGLVVLVAVAALPAPAEEADPVKKRLEESPRHHEWVDIKTKGGRTVQAFLVFPEVEKPVPAVVVIHENRGLTDWVRGVADQLAEAGYVAVAPDLLSQTGPGGGATQSFASSDEARAAIYRLPPEQVLADLDATVEQVGKLDATSGKVAVAGFCWGGGQTFRYATHNRAIAAAFVFYGPAPQEAETLKPIKAPVYGFYGGSDFRITGQVPKVEAMMNELGKAYEPVTYEGAGHGFMRSGENPDASPADRQACAQAWTRWKAVLKKM